MATWVEKFEKLRGNRSYRAIERDAEITANTLSRAVKGTSNLSMTTAMKLAKYLDVSADWLFDDEQDWPPPTHALEPMNANDPEIKALILKLVGDAISDAAKKATEDGPSTQK